MSSTSSSQSITESSFVSSSPSSSSKAQSHFAGNNLDRNNFAQPSFTNTNSNNINSTAGQPWLNLPSPTDINSDVQGDQAQTNAPMICTGRSRSNTLTNTGTAPAEVAAAVINTQFDHVMRPRRPSLVNRPSGSIGHASPSFAQQDLNNNNNNNNSNNNSSSSSSSNNNSMDSRVGSHVPSRHLYPPTSVLPQYHDITTTDNENNSDCLNTEKETSTASWTSYQLGFFPRILVLIGLFGMSLGGLYLIAQVLPPLSLPKSIDDVKVDAEILQEFATATYEGWIRTFWVFSVVYMWKQCFGIPGSAFLVSYFFCPPANHHHHDRCPCVHKKRDRMTTIKKGGLVFLNNRIPWTTVTLEYSGWCIVWTLVRNHLDFSFDNPWISSGLFYVVLSDGAHYEQIRLHPSRPDAYANPEKDLSFIWKVAKNHHNHLDCDIDLFLSLNLCLTCLGWSIYLKQGYSPHAFVVVHGPQDRRHRSGHVVVVDVFLSPPTRGLQCAVLVYSNAQSSRRH
jgi:hypothetical protein